MSAVRFRPQAPCIKAVLFRTVFLFFQNIVNIKENEKPYFKTDKEHHVIKYVLLFKTGFIRIKYPLRINKGAFFLCEIDFYFNAVHIYYHKVVMETMRIYMDI